MAAKLMRQTKITILLCLNAVVILVVGVMIFSAITLNGGIEFKVVSEHSDIISEGLTAMGLISPGTAELTAPAITEKPDGNDIQQNNFGGGTHNAAASSGENPQVAAQGATAGSVGRGEIWSETAMTIYQTADVDICAGPGVTVNSAADMYWQTSNPNVIRKFAAARTPLGYDANTCVTPLIVGTGTVTITAGTYDGSRRDEITVTVVAPPVEQWKRDVLTLVNQERAKAGVGALSWGGTCADAANIRAREIMSSYSHVRPDGSSWSVLCPIPQTGGRSGENLNAGGLAVSPATAVATWMASPEHRSNILNPDFKYLAVGFIFDPSSPYKTYWSQYFSTY